MLAPLVESPHIPAPAASSVLGSPGGGSPPFAPAPSLDTFPHLAGPWGLGCLSLTSCEILNLSPTPQSAPHLHTQGQEWAGIALFEPWKLIDPGSNPSSHTELLRAKSIPLSGPRFDRLSHGGSDLPVSINEARLPEVPMGPSSSRGAQPS